MAQTVETKFHMTGVKSYAFILRRLMFPLAHSPCSCLSLPTFVTRRYQLHESDRTEFIFRYSTGILHSCHNDHVCNSHLLKYLVELWKLVWAWKQYIKGALSFEFCCFPLKTPHNCYLMPFTHAEIFLEMLEKDTNRVFAGNVNHSTFWVWVWVQDHMWEFEKFRVNFSKCNPFHLWHPHVVYIVSVR